MAGGYFEKEWKTIKTNFEKATNKKKPGESFMGVFTKSSGLTPATVAFDTAVEEGNAGPAAKALTGLEKAAVEYQKTLAKAAASAGNDKTLLAELKVMYGEITQLIATATAKVKSLPKVRHIKNAADFKAMMKNPALADLINAYAKKTYTTENIEFLDLMAKKDYSKKTYLGYIKERSKNEINIDSDLRSEFKEDDLKGAPWAEATRIVIDLVNTNIINKLT